MSRGVKPQRMKKYFAFIVASLLILILTGCDTNAADNELSANVAISEEDDSSDTFKVVAMVDSFNTANITEQKLEIETSFGHKYIFDGVIIQEDNGFDMRAVQELLQTQMDSIDLCPTGENDFEIHFIEAVPQSITWYNHYYLDAEAKEYKYPTLQQTKTVGEVGTTLILPIGMNLAIPLDSSVEGNEVIRVLRIVCEYNDQIIEYYVFFQ